MMFYPRDWFFSRGTRTSDTVTRRDGATRALPFALAAIDIDDTLLGPDGRISAANAEAIGELRRRGAMVILASGRSHPNMLRFHHELGLGDDTPIVSAQGAVIRHVGSSAIWGERTMPAALVRAVTVEGMAHGFSVQHYRADGIYIQERSAWNAYDQSRNDTPQQLVDDLLWEGGRGVAKVIWLGAPDEIRGKTAEYTTRYRDELSVTPTDPEYLEFSDVSVDKAAGLAVVAGRLGIARERVVAFGDGYNDVPMLTWAGLGVAMSHARPAAKAASDLVAPDGDPETSLARAIALVIAMSSDSAGARRGL
jgi:Cof subfamily protein (haloacid dehalogenase superfamily)